MIDEHISYEYIDIDILSMYVQNINRSILTHDDVHTSYQYIDIDIDSET